MNKTFPNSTDFEYVPVFTLRSEIFTKFRKTKTKTTKVKKMFTAFTNLSNNSTELLLHAPDLMAALLSHSSLRFQLT